MKVFDFGRKETTMTFELVVKEAENAYILGRISGIIAGITPHRTMRNAFTQTTVGDRRVTVFYPEVTFEEFKALVRILEKEHPGLCNYVL